MSMRSTSTPILTAFALGCALAACAIPAGCGAAGPSDFANRLVDGDGQTILLDDLEDIANDEDLSEDEKRQAFRDIGIEDEELIEALLGL